MTISTASFSWTPENGFSNTNLPMSGSAQLVIFFASGDLAHQWEKPIQQIVQSYPLATIVGCSSAGEILGQEVSDASIVGVALAFDATHTRAVRVQLDGRSTTEAATQLAEQIRGEGLRYVMLLSDGLAVNGSELASTLCEFLSKDVLVTGGLAGDGTRFQQTFVFDGAIAHRDAIVAVGFYGERLKIGHGSLGGWDPFGPTRTVTKSDGNVLFELDNQSALELYKRYLGNYAKELPANGLLFPLSINIDQEGHELVRTLLAVDEDNQTMTFAGTIPQGSRAKLMRANFDRLVEGASGAAAKTLEVMPDNAALALLISCVGRKMVLGDRIEEEAEAVRDVLGATPTLIGFYSYGELSPVSIGNCELHNQTMTITTFAED